MRFLAGAVVGVIGGMFTSVAVSETVGGAVLIGCVIVGMIWQLAGGKG